MSCLTTKTPSARFCTWSLVPSEPAFLQTRVLFRQCVDGSAWVAPETLVHQIKSHIPPCPSKLHYTYHVARRKIRFSGSGRRSSPQRSLACFVVSLHKTSSADDYYRCFFQHKHILDAMGGISSASAVVSLAAQLIVTTRDVINFLREIRDSPEELRYTIELLDLLQDNFEDAKYLVEERNACVDLPSSVSIIKALRFCESRITLVELCVNKFKGVFDRQSTILKKWVSFKHVLKKKEIQRLQDQLTHAINMLQTALITDINRVGYDVFICHV